MEALAICKLQAMMTWSIQLSWKPPHQKWQQAHDITALQQSAVSLYQKNIGLKAILRL